MSAGHRARPARWPRALVLLVGLAYVVVLLTHGRTAPEPDRVPPPATSSTCVPATTRYPDGSTWHKCADENTETPPPAELPPSDPFSEE